MDPATNTQTGQPGGPQKKGQKMDAKLVSDQGHEIKYIAYKYGIPIKVVREVLKETRSRKKAYAILREKGYTINTKKK